MFKRKFVMGFIVLIVLLMTTGCGLLSKGKDIVQDTIAENENNNENVEGADAEEKSDKKEKGSTELGDYEVSLGGDIEETENQFIVHGTSNLLPGSRIVGEVIVDDGETVFSDTSEIVEEDGSFYMELEHHQYGEAEFVIRFDFDNVQDDEIKRHYGEKGQKLEGPFIYRHKTYDGIYQKAEFKLDYTPGGDNDLAIVAPEWMEQPEDYGDPRIWIEVDELTEDGEFFYLHGHSNILEGSELEVQYKFNRNKTNVNPDGSFDFKFDYEYLEDEDIVIIFKPSSYQWNEIEEAYGKTGQKLVGNLVKTNQHNTDQQFIEKRIEWDSEASEMKSGSVNQTRDSEDDDASENNESNNEDGK